MTTTRTRQIPAATETLALHTAVVDALRADGFEAHVEYPGAVSIRIDEDEQVWTGLVSWAYGSVSRRDVENDTWEPVEGVGESIDVHGVEDDGYTVASALVLASKWAQAVVQRRSGKAAAGRALAAFQEAQRALATAYDAWTSTNDQYDTDAYLEPAYPFALSLDEQVAALGAYVERLERTLGL